MSNHAKFKQYCLIADQLLQNSSKEDLSEAIVLLGMELAQYHTQFGVLNLSKNEVNAKSTEPNDQQFALLAEGMLILANVLGSVATKASQVKQ